MAPTQLEIGVWGSVGDGRAIFLLSMALKDLGGLRSGWMGRRGLSGDAFGC